MIIKNKILDIKRYLFSIIFIVIMSSVFGSIFTSSYRNPGFNRKIFSSTLFFWFSLKIREEQRREKKKNLSLDYIRLDDSFFSAVQAFRRKTFSLSLSLFCPLNTNHSISRITITFYYIHINYKLLKTRFFLRLSLFQLCVKAFEH